MNVLGILFVRAVHFHTAFGKVAVMTGLLVPEARLFEAIHIYVQVSFGSKFKFIQDQHMHSQCI